MFHFSVTTATLIIVSLLAQQLPVVVEAGGKIVPNCAEVCNAPTMANAAPTLEDVAPLDMGSNSSVEAEFSWQTIEANQTCVEHEGLTRCWYTYVPESAKVSTSPVPLVLDMHGYNLCAVQTALYTGWARVAHNENKEGFVVVWPQGNMDLGASRNPCWDYGECCCYLATSVDPSQPPPPANISDVGFLRQIVANIAHSSSISLGVGAGVDTRRVYFAGHSNGCIMAQAMAAMDSDLVAAVGCHAGNLIIDPSMLPFPGYRATSVQVVYGDLDVVVNSTLGLGSVATTLDLWGSMNMCTTNRSVVDESNLYATHIRSNCSNGTEIRMVEVFDAGHFTYLGVEPNTSLSIRPIPGAKTPAVDTTLLSWEFVRKYRRDVAPDLPAPANATSPDVFVQPQSPKPEDPNSTASIVRALPSMSRGLLTLGSLLIGSLLPWFLRR